MLVNSGQQYITENMLQSFAFPGVCFPFLSYGYVFLDVYRFRESVIPGVYIDEAAFFVVKYMLWSVTSSLVRDSTSIRHHSALFSLLEQPLSSVI